MLATIVVLAFRIGQSSSTEVDFRDPTAWLESEATGELVKVNGATSEITARIDISSPGSDIQVAQDGSGAFALNVDGAELGRVDGVLLQLAPKVNVSDAAGDVSLAAGGESVFLVDDDSVEVFAADDLSLTASLPLESPTLHTVADSSGVLWGLDAEGRMLRATPDGISSNSPTRSLGDVLDLVTISGEAYLLDFNTGQITAVKSNADLGSTLCLAGPRGELLRSGGTASPADAPFAMVSDSTNGALHITNVSSNSCDTVSVAPDGAELGAPVESGGLGYVANFDTGQVVIIELDDLRVIRTVRVSPPGQLDLTVKDGLVWFNDPTGSSAGVLDRTEVLQLKSGKFDTVATGEGVGEGVGSDIVLDDEGIESGTVVGDEVGEGSLPGSGSDGADAGSDGPGTDDAVEGADRAADEGSPAADGDLPGAPGNPIFPPVTEPVADDSELEPAPGEPEEEPIPELDPLPEDGDELQADFTFTSERVQVGEPVTFTDTSRGDPDSWSWTFDDGTSASGPSATKSWDIEGQFDVTLFVDSATESSSASHVITVLPDNVAIPPKAAFTFDNGTIEAGQSVTFFDRSTGSPTTVDWTFGDGNSGSGGEVSHTYDEPGRYTVTLRSANDVGSDSATASILVLDSVSPPVATISPSTRKVDVGDFVVFRSQSTGNPTVQEWNFDDGARASGVEVQHSFSEAGTYEVALFVENSAGSDTDTVLIEVQRPLEPPVARIDGAARSTNVGTSECFVSTSTNNPTQLSWDFGDGGTAAGQSVCHTFTASGRYEVTLTASNSAGSDDDSVTVRVASPPPAPVARFGASPRRPAAGVAVSFTDTSLNDPTSWRWDFGDGGSSSAQNPSHSYDGPGTYTVTLTATNGEGSDSSTESISVVEPAPIADFTLTDSNPELGETVSFTDTSRNAPNRWSWDFGDGTTSTLANPTHAYSSAGTYTVVLKVWNEQGSDSSATTIEVDPPPPIAEFVFSPSSPNTATKVAFTDTSSAGPTSWGWDFGDGGTWNGQAPPTHVFQDAGSYVVTLTACNAGGSKCDTFSKTIRVIDAPEPPVAIFSSTPSGDVPVGTTVQFKNQSTNNPETHRWTFHEGTVLTYKNPTFTYGFSGSFPVTLEVCNDGGCDSTRRDITVVIDPPQANFSVADSTVDVGDAVVFTDLSTDDPETWSWDFDDGSTSSARNPSHVFASPGSYQVTLTVSNGGGSNSRTRTVKVLAIPATTTTSTTSTSTTTTSTTSTTTTSSTVPPTSSTSTTTSTTVPPSSSTTSTSTSTSTTTSTTTTSSTTTSTTTTTVAPTTAAPTTAAPTTAAPTTAAPTTTPTIPSPPTTGTSTQGSSEPWQVGGILLIGGWVGFIARMSRRRSDQNTEPSSGQGITS